MVNLINMFEILSVLLAAMKRFTEARVIGKSIHQNPYLQLAQGHKTKILV